MNDDFFPDRAPDEILQIVDFIENDVCDVVQCSRTGVDHVPQDFSGHHHHRRLAVDRVVSGQEPNPFCSVDLAELDELLVAQSFDRRRIERPASALNGQMNRSFCNQSLACAGRR